MTGPLSSAPPHVAVVVQQGRQLTGAVGSWSGSGAIKYAYQWYRCNTAGAHCKSIHGATSRTYTLVAKDVGQTLGFSVRATDRPERRVRTRASSGRSRDRSARLVSTGQPTITGVPKEGQTLQVSAGSWSPTPATIAYQWQRCNRERAPLRAAPRSDREHLHRHAPPTPATPCSPSSARRSGAASQHALSVATPAGRHRPDDRPVEPRAADSGRDEPAGQAAHGLDREPGRARARSATATSGTAATPRARTARRSTARRGRPTRSSPRTSARRSASPSMPPTPRVPLRPTRASSARSRGADATLVADGATDDRRRSPGRARRSRSPTGSWNQQARLRHVRVATLQPERPPLRPDRRRDGRHLRRHGRRRRPCAARGRPGRGERRLAGDPQRRHRGRLLSGTRRVKESHP